MQQLISNILCLIGTIYLFWRIGVFLKTVFQLVWKSKKTADKSTLTEL